MLWIKRAFGAIVACAILSTQSSASGAAVAEKKCWSNWYGYCYCVVFGICGTPQYTGCSGNYNDECDRAEW